MASILPVNFGNSNVSNDSNKTDTAVNSNTKREYPLTYEQFKMNSIASGAFGSIAMGGFTACIMKVMRLKTLSAVIGGLIIAVGSLAVSIINGLNGNYKLKYIEKKERFENPQTIKKINIST